MKTKNWITSIKLAAAAAGVLGLMVTAPAPVAADTITIPVSATVVGVCKFTTSSPTTTLTIANSGASIDPSLGSNATGTKNLDYKCTKGVTPGFTFASGGTLTLNCGACVPADSMPASMTISAPAVGAGFAAAAQTVTVTGTIIPADFDAASAGTYSANEIVTITP